MPRLSWTGLPPRLGNFFLVHLNISFRETGEIGKLELRSALQLNCCECSLKFTCLRYCQVKLQAINKNNLFWYEFKSIEALLLENLVLPCLTLVGNHWPLTLMSNWICWYLEALNNILFSAMSEIILILLFQFLKAQTDWPSNNCCEFSVCFLCPDPLLVAAESLGSGGARIVLLILSSARLRETNINQWENRTEIKWPI